MEDRKMTPIRMPEKFLEAIYGVHDYRMELEHGWVPATTVSTRVGCDGEWTAVISCPFGSDVYIIQYYEDSDGNPVLNQVMIEKQDLDLLEAALKMATKEEV